MVDAVTSHSMKRRSTCFFIYRYDASLYRIWR